MEEKPVTTIEKIKRVKGWEQMPDELAEKVAYALKRLAEIFYTTIARDMNLAPIPVKEDGTVIPLYPEEEQKQNAA